MCTLILATHHFDDSDLFLASNRDESLARPAVGPMIWDESTRFVAPRDEQEGGTWLGVNEHGVLVAITNRFGSPRLGDRRSRGELVLDALRTTSAEEAARQTANESPGDYNPFHLLMASEAGAFVVWSDGEEMHSVSLSPGIHVFTERSFGAAENGRAAFLEQSIDTLMAQGNATRTELAALLRVRGVDDPSVTCISIPALNYGTRSSALIDVTRRELHYADGPPCDVDYEAASELLEEVLA